MNKKYRRFEDINNEMLQDRDEAIGYLEVALEDYEETLDLECFLLALKDVANAQGGIGKLSKKTNLNRQGLYRALSKDGNPRLETLVSILKTLGLRLSVKPIEADLVA